MEKHILRTIIFTIVFVIALIIHKIAVAQDVIHCSDYQDIKDFAKCEVDKHWEDQWEYFDYIVDKESNWISQAQNTESSAFGLGQFLTQTWAMTNYKKSDDPQIQILAMIEYIDIVYGLPQKAYQKHLLNNWY